MNAGHRIEFTVFGRYGEDVVVHSTRDEAEEEIKRCLEEDKRLKWQEYLWTPQSNPTWICSARFVKQPAKRLRTQPKWSSKFSEKQKSSGKKCYFYLAFLGTEPELVHDLIFCVR